jgi:hypothetical protein
MNFLEQLDECWREMFAMFGHDEVDRSAIQTKYAEFVAKIQAQVSHLPQPEQDWLMLQVASRNAEHIALARRDHNALKARLGLPALTPEANQLVQVATVTAVRATVWRQGVSAIGLSRRTKSNKRSTASGASSTLGNLLERTSQAAAGERDFCRRRQAPKTCLRDETYAQRRKSRPHDREKPAENRPFRRQVFHGLEPGTR